MPKTILVLSLTLALLAPGARAAMSAPDTHVYSEMPFPEVPGDELNRVVDQLMERLALGRASVYPGTQLAMRDLLIEAASSHATPNARYFNGANVTYYKLFIQELDGAPATERSRLVGEIRHDVEEQLQDHPVTGPKVRH